MSVSRRLVADAAKKHLHEKNVNTFHENNFQNCFVAIEKLSLFELKSVFFLLLDFIGIEMYISLIMLPVVELQAKLLCIVQQIGKTSCFGEQLILEILGTMKKFKLLKTLGLCKHEFLQMETKQSHIKPFWKLLYGICANLDDSELQKLRVYFSLAIPLTCAEDILCHLIQSKIINEEEKFCKFIKALMDIDRQDLVEEINLYIEASMRKYVQVYNLRNPTLHNPCGLALIINQESFQRNSICLEEQLPFLEERIGSQLDREKLKKLWTNFGFQTEVHNNLTTMDMEYLFSNLSSRNYKDFDIFVACLLSHGDKDVIYGSDCRPLKIDYLIHVVDKCSFLNGKPKLFFIQACQGQTHQDGVFINNRNNICLELDAVPEHSDLPELNDNYIIHSDVYKAIAVIKGYVSYRSPSAGSLFITKLVEHLETCGDEIDLEVIMKEVKASTAAAPCKQMPITSGTLRKSVIFKRLTI